MGTLGCCNWGSCRPNIGVPVVFLIEFLFFKIELIDAVILVGVRCFDNAYYVVSAGQDGKS